MCCLSRELFGRCTVDICDGSYSVDYFLTSSTANQDEGEDGLVHYGIELVKHPQQESCSINSVSTEVEEVKLILSLLLQGEVTPVGALDVVQDLLVARSQIVP